MTAENVQAACLSFKTALNERTTGGELTHHLGIAGEAGPMTRTTTATERAEDGSDRGWSGARQVPRDRDGSYEPMLIPKHERRLTGFDDKIVAMCARG